MRGYEFRAINIYSIGEYNIRPKYTAGDEPNSEQQKWVQN
jgi:hypothetical protein